MRDRFSRGLFISVVLLLTGCQVLFNECVTDDDCSDGRTCVNRRCFGHAVDVGDADTAPVPDAAADTGGTDTSPCIPICDERQCGPDGCGGSCGECLPDMECQDGSCRDPLCGNGVIDPGESCEFVFGDEPLEPDDFCPFNCDDGDACTIDEMLGAPEECNAECRRTTIVECIDGDDCCPPDCTIAVDGDCPSICGDGRIDSGETCDGDCPTRDECDDGAACTIDSLGSPALCTARCVRFVLDECRDGDGCCLSTCTTIEDSDCPAAPCERYCSMTEDYCRGEDALFSDTDGSGSSVDECLTACEQFTFATGVQNRPLGDTLWCRIHQLSLAIHQPDVYCPEASAKGSTACE